MALGRTFEIYDDDEKGGVWLLLFDGGQEIGRDFFLLTYYGNYTSDEDAWEWARVDARGRGQEWVSSVSA